MKELEKSAMTTGATRSNRAKAGDSGNKSSQSGTTRYSQCTAMQSFCSTLYATDCAISFRPISILRMFYSGATIAGECSLLLGLNYRYHNI